MGNGCVEPEEKEAQGCAISKLAFSSQVGSVTFQCPYFFQHCMWDGGDCDRTVEWLVSSAGLRVAMG